MSTARVLEVVDVLRWLAMVCWQTMRGHFWFGPFAVTSRSSTFGAMLNVWSLSVRRRRNDPPDHFLTLLHLEFACSFNDDPVVTHQPSNPPPLAVCKQTVAAQRCTVIHLFSVDIPTPSLTAIKVNRRSASGSSASGLRVSPLLSAIRSASPRNSSVLPCPMIPLLCCTIR
jgi:hypothetical protein